MVVVIWWSWIFFWRIMKRELKEVKMMVMLKVEIRVMEVVLWW